MKLTINGNTERVPTTITTIKEVIEHYQINNPVVIVEHNDVIIEKSAHADTKIKNGDKLELIQFVGGG